MGSEEKRKIRRKKKIKEKYENMSREDGEKKCYGLKKKNTEQGCEARIAVDETNNALVVVYRVPAIPAGFSVEKNHFAKRNPKGSFFCDGSCCTRGLCLQTSLRCLFAVGILMKL
jgi:hypothetical protein